jgi:hypothetical protein
MLADKEQVRKGIEVIKLKWDWQVEASKATRSD